jgi:hypothetical protein
MPETLQKILFLTQTTNNFNFKDPNLHFGVNATYIIHTKKKKIKEITY